MIILGIETSCDETALALIETKGVGDSFECRVMASLVHSQAELHSAYGGVYPSLAKREHGKNIVGLLHKLFIEAYEGESVPLSEISKENVLNQFREEVGSQNPELFQSFTEAKFLEKVPEIDRIAVTEGPGLEPALWVGINFARMLSALWDIPLLPIDHMEGHVLGSLLPTEATNRAWTKLHQISFPALALLISGGHTEIVKIDSWRKYEVIGETKDDAVGEAFDKVARLLGLSYPGGPHLAELSHKAWEEKIPSPVKLPRPMLDSGDLNFSFSGLKTAVLYAVGKAEKDKDGNLTESWKKGLAHEFEQAVTETLDTKLRLAIEMTGAKAIIVGGGVSANHVIRKALEKTAAEHDLPIFLPSKHISGDNALMIALAGALHPDTTTPGALRAQGTKRLGGKI